MTSGWSLFIVIVTIVNIVACLWLLRWTMKPRAAGEKIGGGADTGHVWDQDLREYNNPLPKWWLWVFYLTVAFGLVYLALYPGLGTWKGTQGWSQASQYQQEKDAVEATAAAYTAPFASMTVQQLADDPKAMAAAHNIFQNNCAQCHGSDGGGTPGHYPNLANSDWQWGGDAVAVVTTITGGRTAMMLPKGGANLDEQGVKQVVAYARTLSGQPADATLAAAGKATFDTVCFACHGPDGKGNPIMGAPNLTDNVWLYGGDEATITETVTKGRTGQMPAWGDKLGEQRVKLLAAYVTRLANTGS